MKKRTLQWLVVIIVIIFFVRGMLAVISINTLLFLDNLLYAGSTSAWIMWAFLGLLLGVVVGAWVAFKKYKLAYSSVLLPLAVLLLFIVVMYLANKPGAHDTTRLERKTADATQFVTVAASGTLPDYEGNNYAPDNLLDNNDSTAWICTTDGIGKVEFTFSSYLSKLRDAKCVALKIKNGYNKSQKIYKNHNRLKTLFAYNNGSMIGTYSLNDDYNLWQTIAINPVPVKEGDVLSITPGSVYRGKKYTDQTAVTELVPVVEFYEK